MVSKQFVFASWLVLAGAVAGCAGNNATCPEACASSQICCDGQCVFNLVDRNHCGACGNFCAGICSDGVCSTSGLDAGDQPDRSIMPGMCSPTCAADERCCGTSCVDREQPINVDGRPASSEDPRSPFNNCNGCGLRCDPTTAISCSSRTGSPPACMCGDFGACTLPGDVCANDGGRFQCINTSNNTMHCGSIGNACAPGEACSGGMCVCGSTGGRCGAGQACCAGACIDVSSDAANCGACGNACGDNAPNCQGGTCVCGTGAGARTCAATTMTALGESCCDGMCVANNNSNCGCGIMCNTADDETCIVDMGLFGMGGTGGVCCGTAGFPPLIPGFCAGGIGFGDAGFPGLGDGGLPFP